MKFSNELIICELLCSCSTLINLNSCSYLILSQFLTLFLFISLYSFCYLFFRSPFILYPLYFLSFLSFSLSGASSTILFPFLYIILPPSKVGLCSRGCFTWPERLLILGGEVVHAPSCSQYLLPRGYVIRWKRCSSSVRQQKRRKGAIVVYRDERVNEGKDRKGEPHGRKISVSLRGALVHDSL